MNAPASRLAILVNGKPHQCAPETTLAALLGELGLAGKKIAVERNGEIVPRSVHGATVLGAGDRLEVVVAVGGG